MTQEHDYKAALEKFMMLRAFEPQANDEEKWNALMAGYYTWIINNEETILHALKLTDKVTGEPSEEMCKEGDKTLGCNLPCTVADIEDNRKAFKAMIAQARKEIEDEN
jgi:hypothetical protein